MAEKDELQKLQDKYQVTLDLLRRVVHQERTTTINRQRLHLVSAELKGLPDSTLTFKQIGKAYFMQPKTKLVDDAEAEVKAAEVEVEGLKSKKLTFEAKAKEIHKEIIEMSTLSH